MSIKGNGGVQGAGGGNKPESAEELKKKQAAEQDRAAQQGAAADQAELTDGLTGQDRAGNGNGNGNRVGNGNGAGTGAGNEIGNMLGGYGNGGNVQMGGFGYGGVFSNQSLDVDQAQLNDLSNKFFNFTMSAGALPFGIGTAAMQNSIGNWFQSFMNCFKFSGSTQTVHGGYQGFSATNVNGVYTRDGKYYKPDANGNMQECKQDGSALDAGRTSQPVAPSAPASGTGNVPDGYTATGTDGVYTKDGKYYHYVNGALVECNADGSAISHKVDDGAVKGKDKAHHKATAEKKESPAKKEEAKAKTPEELGYKKMADGTYRKGGKSYNYVNGTFQYAYDTKYKNGQYVKNGTVYNADGTKSAATVKGHAGQDSIHTLEYYKSQGYTMTTGHDGKTVLTSKDKRETLYFDKSGKLVQQNFHNTGFMKDGRTEVSRFKYNEKTGQLQSREDYNNQTRTTVKTEYVSPKGLKAGTTKTVGKPQVRQEMDSQGRTTTFKEQETITTKIEIKGGIAVKTTTIQSRPVK